MTGWDLPDTAVTVTPGRASGALAAPGSKSVTNRLLVMAALADGESLLDRPLQSDDAEAMRGLVEALGARVSDDGHAWRVAGTAGRLVPRQHEIDVRQSGTSMRFGTALAALAESPVTLTGDRPLLARPVGPLTQALHALGANLADDGGFPPVRLHGGGIQGGPVTIDVTGSSQFASAVLLAAPYAKAQDVVVRTRGASAASYIGLTVASMREWGVKVTATPGEWHVERGRYQARAKAVEYDASAAAHLFAVAAASGGSVTVTNVSPTLQADAGFPQLLADMGCAVEYREDEGSVTVAGPTVLTGLGTCDLGEMPDQLPNLAVLAALAKGETEIRNVEVVRGHETDRIAKLHHELRKLGVSVEEFDDGLLIKGGVSPPVRPIHLHTYDDHRLAMAFAALAARVPGVVIEEPWCVRKTYPRFWSDLSRLGLAWEPAA